MHDPDVEVRSRAVGIAWFAVRQMFQLLDMDEPVGALAHLAYR